jgi:hypothetical protein
MFQQAFDRLLPVCSYYTFECYGNCLSQSTDRCGGEDKGTLQLSDDRYTTVICSMVTYVTVYLLSCLFRVDACLYEVLYRLIRTDPACYFESVDGITEEEEEEEPV